MAKTIYGVRLDNQDRERERWFRDDPEGAIEWALDRAQLKGGCSGHAVVTLVRSGRVLGGFFRDEKNE